MDQDWDETLEHRLLHRLMFFTDAVFAIVMTLLVLELHPPPAADAAQELRSLAALNPHFVAFVLSFAIIGIFWLAHMSSTRGLLRFDWPTAAVNMAGLLPVCLIPFASAWVGEAFASPRAWMAYCAVLLATSIGGVALVLVETRGGGRLLAKPVTRQERFHRALRAAIPGVAFGTGVIGLSAGVLWIGQYCWAIIPVLSILLRTVWKPRARSAPLEA